MGNKSNNNTPPRIKAICKVPIANTIIIMVLGFLLKVRKIN